MDEETDDVYVQSINSLLNYSPDLKLQKTLITGKPPFIVRPFSVIEYGHLDHFS